MDDLVKHRKIRSLARLTCLAAALALFAFPAAARAGLSKLSWSAPISIDREHGVALNSVACAPAPSTQCTAVDGSGNEVTFNPGTGTILSGPTPLDTGGSLASVACPTETQCTAVDTSGNEVTFEPKKGMPNMAGLTPLDTTPLDTGRSLASVACPTETQCTAVDTSGNEVTFNPGTGTILSGPTPLDTGGSLASVACPTRGQCTAVGGGEEITFTLSLGELIGSPAPTKIDSGGDLQSIACPTAGQCTAIDTRGYEVTFKLSSGSLSSNGTPEKIDSGGYYISVACPTGVTTPCVAVDESGHEVTFDPNTAITSQTLREENIDSRSSGYPTSVACPTGSQCTAVGSGGREATFEPTSAPGPFKIGSPALIDSVGSYLTSVACPTGGQCTAVDSEGSYLYGEGHEVTFDPSTLLTTPALTPIPIDSSNFGYLTSVACPSPSVNQCTAVDSRGDEVTFDPTTTPPTTLTTRLIESSVALFGIACPTVSVNCTAVGSNGQEGVEVTFNPKTFVAPPPTPTLIDSGGYLTSVACPSLNQCTAVDSSGYEVTFEPGSLSIPTPTLIDSDVAGGSYLTSVACPSTTLCVAVDGGRGGESASIGGEGHEVTFEPSLIPGAAKVSPLTTIDSIGGLTSVACPTKEQCTAVDSGGHEVTFNPESPEPTTQTLIDQGGLTSIACPTDGQCVAVDRAGNAIVGTTPKPPPACNEDPAIEPQPKSTTVQEPNTATFTAGAPTLKQPPGCTIAPTVQWYSKAPGAGSFSPISSATPDVKGVTADTLEIEHTTVLEEGTEYEAVFTNSWGYEVSQSALLTVNSASCSVSPTITTEPEEATVTAGATATFTAAASMPAGCTAPTVQWEEEPLGGSSFSPISGANSDTLEIKNTTVLETGTKYEAVFKNGANEARTLPAILHVEENLAENSEIEPTPNPTFLLEAAGATETFKVIVTAITENGFRLSGEEITLHIPALGGEGIVNNPVKANGKGVAEFEVTCPSGYCHRGQKLEITATDEQGLSLGMAYEEVELLENAGTASGPEPVKAETTDSALSATGTGGTGTVTVGEYGSDPEKTLPFESNGKFFDVYLSRGASFEELKITDCDLGTGGTGIEWYNPQSTKTDKWEQVVSVPAAVKSGSCFTFTINEAPPARVASKPSLKQLTGTVFAVVTTSPPACAASPAIEKQPESKTVTAPGMATFEAAGSTPANCAAPTVQWYSEAPGGSSFSLISGATSASYTTPATTVAESGTKYEAVFKNAHGETDSSAATLTVNPAPTCHEDPSITKQPSNQIVTAPGTATFDAAASTPANCGAPTVQWYSEAPGASSFSLIGGATSTSYTTPATTVAESGTKYKAVFKNAHGETDSNAATLTVKAPTGTPPTVSRILPNRGSAGWITVIFGSHFDGSETVYFGSAPALFWVLTPDIMIAEVPGHDSGTVNVTVHTAKLTSPSTSADRFTFITNPWTIFGFAGRASGPTTKVSAKRTVRVRLTSAERKQIRAFSHGKLNPAGVVTLHR
jgi:hypothetical protein